MAEWLEQIREGSSAGFDRFYAEAAPFVTGIACRMLGDRMEAEDVCHDVLLAVIDRPERYDPSRGSVEAWLAVQTKSQCVDRLRKRKRLVAEAREPNGSAAYGGAEEERAYGQPEKQALARLEREALRDAIGQLPFEQRQALTEAYWSSRSHRELSELWNMPVGTVKSRIRYGLGHLRKTLERMGWSNAKGGEGGG